MDNDNIDELRGDVEQACLEVLEEVLTSETWSTDSKFRAIGLFINLFNATKE